MDFANFSQSLTPVLPRGHRGLPSSCGQSPETRRQERLCPDSPQQSSRPAQPTQSSRAASKSHLNFQRRSVGTQQRRLLGFFRSPPYLDLPAVPHHSSQCAQRGSVQGPALTTSTPHPPLRRVSIAAIALPFPARRGTEGA